MQKQINNSFIFKTNEKIYFVDNGVIYKSRKFFLNFSCQLTPIIWLLELKALQKL